MLYKTIFKKWSVWPWLRNFNQGHSTFFDQWHSMDKYEPDRPMQEEGNYARIIDIWWITQTTPLRPEQFLIQAEHIESINFTSREHNA